jgi:hypothetical protein
MKKMKKTASAVNRSNPIQRKIEVQQEEIKAE